MKDQEIKEEHWVPAKYIKHDGSVLDFTGLYEVSDQGRIRSLRFSKTKILNLGTYENTDGSIYYMVGLYLNSKQHLLLVHRLVLSSFKEREYFSGAVCDHIVARSETGCCNHLDNLHWVTQQQNSSTDHCKTLTSKANTNHPSYSKHVRVTDLTTGETTIYPSAREVGRSLGINPKSPAACISKCNGFYKRLNLLFEYIE